MYMYSTKKLLRVHVDNILRTKKKYIPQLGLEKKLTKEKVGLSAH